jgi:hypothetical protein
MSLTDTQTCTWTPTKHLESMLTMAIAQVRSAEVQPEVLAKTIMVAIQTEVARSREEVVRSVAAAMRGTQP